jgi:hypothetical protein
MKKTMYLILFILAVMLSITPVYAISSSLTGTSVISLSIANYEPDPAIAGDIVEVRLGVSNIGSDTVSNLMVEVMPEYPFVLVPGETAARSIGILKGYKPDSTENINIIKYRMQVDKNTPAGSYELKVKYYEKGGTSSTPKSLSLDVKSKQNAEVIHIDKTILVPGKQTGMKFTINNVGNAPLRDLTFYWENEENIILPVGSDNTRYLKYIDVGDGADLEYQVISDTNAIPGLYKLNLYLTYEDPISKTEKKISTIAGVYVGGGTDFDVAFSESASGETSFSVANIGSNPANSVSVIIPEQRNWKVSGSNSVIIGNLNKGDYTVASFKLQSSTSTTTSQNRTAPAGANIQERSMQRPMNSSINGSSDTVLMQIAYTDTMGERNIIEKAVKITGVQGTAVTNGMTTMQWRRGAVQQEGVSYIWYFIGIAALVAGFGAYGKYKKCRLLDPDFKIRDFLKRKTK